MGLRLSNISSIDHPCHKIYANHALTTGAASEVPSTDSYKLSIEVVIISTPGAAISTRHPWLENDAFCLLLSTAPTAITSGYAAG